MITGIPERQRSESDITVADLVQFQQEMQDRRVAKSTAALFAHMAVRQPHIRLGINLKSAINCMISRGGCKEVLQNGLSTRERLALLDLDWRGISVKGREVAHGLLNIHERWLIMNKVHQEFDRLRCKKGAYIEVGVALTEEDFNGGSKK